MSFKIEAKIKPKPMKPAEINAITKRAKKKDKKPGILKPIPKAIKKIKIAWIKEVVIPPKILPMAIETLETGATMISFRNPNSLSHKTERPDIIDVEIKVIPIIPGTKKKM